jgi:2-methylcitrate dehydratase PrpD
VINLAASMSPANTWTPALEGATIRNLYPGRSAFQGILAAELQACGFTGLADAPSDVYGRLLAERFDPALAVAGLDEVGRGAPFRIEQNYFKLHACCRYNHFALDAVLDLRARHDLGAADIERVEVTTIPFGERMAEAEPTSMLGAKFSIPYAVAAALVLGRTDVSAFVPPAFDDPALRALARRVSVWSDPEMSPRRSDRPTARVRVVLRDGRILEGSTTSVRGDAEAPVSAETLDAKFIALASPVLGEDDARAVVELVGAVERLEEVSTLTARLTGRRSASRRPSASRPGEGNRGSSRAAGHRRAPRRAPSTR